MSKKKGEGEVQARIAKAIQKAGKKGITSAQLAERVGCNRQYVRLVLRTTLASNITDDGTVASSVSAPRYIWKS